MPQDRTESQRAASRANGAKSHGPITVMGRDIASKNAIKHGLLANTLLIPGENREALEALSANFYICFRPESDLEDLYVQRMVEADWKLKRVRSYEQAALAREIAAQGPEIPITIDDDCLLYPMARNAAAFETLLSGKGKVIQTSAMRYQREFNQARDAFFKLRENAQKWRIPSNEPSFSAFEPGDLVENTQPDPPPSNPDAGIHAAEPPAQAAPEQDAPLEFEPAAAHRQADTRPTADLQETPPASSPTHRPSIPSTKSGNISSYTCVRFWGSDRLGIHPQSRQTGEIQKARYALGPKPRQRQSRPPDTRYKNHHDKRPKEGIRQRAAE